MFIATLIAADGLSGGDISVAEDALRAAGLAPAARRWIDEGSACDILFEGGSDAGVAARKAIEGRITRTDLVVQPAEGRRKRLLAADMDSTMIAVECIDELADYAGLKAEVAAVTERAMRGEIDFEAALSARVALLKGLEEAAIDACRDERVTMMPGGRTLVRTMKAHGAFCLLVSGGFTRFAEPIAEAIGFDSVTANRLDVADGRLAGTVAPPVVGPEGKRLAMVEAAQRLGLDVADTMAVGDGANDRPMIEAAGIGIAFRAKPALAGVADARIDHGDLTALLHAQGYRRSDWVED